MMRASSEGSKQPPKKRSRDAMSASKASSELLSSLSSSLHRLLLQHPPTPPLLPSQWLEDAKTQAGVSSNVAALKLWSEYGRENDEEFCNARYLIWVCEDVLLAAGDGLHALQSWQRSLEALITAASSDGIFADSAEEGEMGVMWRMLLHSLHLTPAQLHSAYRKFLEYNPHIRNVDDISYLFMWPSFFRDLVGENINHTVRDKRRKTSNGLQQQSNLTNTAWWPLLGYSIAHATLSNVHNDDNYNFYLTTNAIQQKIRQLQSIMDTLPSLMGIPSFDHIKKHSLLSGVVACILDVLGEGLVFGGTCLDEGIGGGGLGGEAKQGGIHDILGAEVEQIVDLLICHQGALSSLAKRINTPIANLVSEAAEMILNFSEVHHRLLNNLNDEDNDSPTTPQHIQKDATKVVQFIAKANPQLGREFSNWAFIPQHYLSTEVFLDANLESLPPMHPIVVDIRARLAAGKIRDVANICRHLEDCSGISLQVKQHSWMLLLEKMHVRGTLIEDASTPQSNYGIGDDGVGEEVLTLGNIIVGSVGRSCVLEYLANVVLEAREKLFPNQRGTSPQAKQELRCLKDAVRRTLLKFLVTRAYSTRDALTISNKISDASNVPSLVDYSSGSTAVEEATRILSTKLLYEEYNENLDYDHDDEEEALDADERKEKEVLNEDGPMDMSVDQIGTPFVSRKATDNHVAQVSSPNKIVQSAVKSPEQKLKRWQMVVSSSKKRQNLRKPTLLTSPSLSPASATKMTVNERELENLEEEMAGVHDAESPRKLAIDFIGENDQHQEEEEESVDDEHDSSQEDVASEMVDSDATRSIESNDANEALDETGEEVDVTYPHHYHEYPGNYSESDDYEQEDEEEAERHVAFHEPAGDASEGDSSNVDGPDVIDLLDESSDSEEDQDEDISDENAASSEDERDEAEVLNESVNEYLAAQERESDGEDDEYGLNAEDVEDTDLNMADDEHDTEDDKYSLTEASQQGETFDEGEVNRPLSPRITYSIGADQLPSVLVAAAMSSQRQSAASNAPFRRASAGNLSFDNTSAALASTDANLSEYYDVSEYHDDKNQGENDEQPNVEVIARHHGHDLAINSLLDAHVDAVDSGDESSNAEKNNETGQGQMTDDGYDAEVSEVEQTNIDKMTRSKAADDDGYLPDAEVSEVDQIKMKKPKKKIEDEGYVPDGGHTTGGEEASEVEQGDYSNKKNKRDVRFEVEANLETMIAPSESVVEPSTNLSIDDGYLPTDDGLTEEEKGPTAKSLAVPAPSIDEGYIPDSGAITEEERLVKERKRRRYMDAVDAGYVPDGHTTAGEGEVTDASQVGLEAAANQTESASWNEGSNEMKSSSKPIHSNERLEDLIDEGYLPSAVEGTEEERSEEEGANSAGETNISRSRSEPSHSSEKEEQAFPSVLVATATVLQQGGSGTGGVAQKASLSMKDAGNDDAESYTSDGEMSGFCSTNGSSLKDPSLTMKSPSTLDTPAVPVEKTVTLPEKLTASEFDQFPDDKSEVVKEAEEEMVEDDNSLASMTVAKLKEIAKKRGLKCGGRKADIIQRIKDHDTAEKPVKESTASESIVTTSIKPTKKRGRKRSPLYEALEEHDKTLKTESTEGKQYTESISTSVRRSARARKMSPKIAPKLDTPISALTHQSDSESDDDQSESIESKKDSTARQSRHKTHGQKEKAIPKAISTGRKKDSKLPALPEGGTLEEMSKPVATSTRRSTRASSKMIDTEITSVTSSQRPARSSKKKDETESTSALSRRSTMNKAEPESVASRVSRRSTKGKNKRFQ